MVIFINNKSTKFGKITLRIKRFIHKSGFFFLHHGVDEIQFIRSRYTQRHSQGAVVYRHDVFNRFN